MAIDFEWSGSGWIARKVRRKLTQYEHRGVEFYDRERMRKPLPPIVHPRDFEGWSTPLPSWIDPKWSAPDDTAIACGRPSPIDALDAPPIAQTADYTLERCHVETVCVRREWQSGEWTTMRQPVTYRWELTFKDGATFQFVSRAIAETALSELLKIRKAKHPRPTVGKHSAGNSCVYFSDRKLQQLAVDTWTGEPSTSNVPIETAA